MNVIMLFSVLELYSEFVGLCMILICLRVFRFVKLWLVLVKLLMLNVFGMVMLLVWISMWLLFRLWIWKLFSLKWVGLLVIDMLGL